MCCDGCPSAYHPACLGFEAAPGEAWYCPACVQVRGAASGQLPSFKDGRGRMGSLLALAAARLGPALAPA
jgi:hypothetical protein